MSSVEQRGIGAGKKMAVAGDRPKTAASALNALIGEDSDKGVKCAKRVKCRKGEVPRGLKSPTLHVLVAVSQC